MAHLAVKAVKRSRSRRRSSSLSRINELKKKTGGGGRGSSRPLKVTPALMVDEWDVMLSRAGARRDKGSNTLPRSLKEFRSKSR